jgi:alpha-beta hydrolase superfamily lysophospholipase
MSAVPGDSTLSTFTASDGDNLAVQDWPLPEGLTLRGVVVLVHGLGEHAGRYDHLARRLNEWGFAVRGYDHYGHGESGGVRGALSGAGRLLDDLADIIDSTRSRMEADTPLILLGHSMGALVASCLVAQKRVSVEGLVLSSPAFKPRLGPLQRLLVAILPRIAPNFTTRNGVDADFISHDRAVVDAYKADPLVHNRISARLARFIATAGPWVVSRAASWTVPTLLMYAGQDQLVHPGGSRAFAANARKDMVAVRCFHDHFHEIFNEAEAEPVFTQLRHWLDEFF